MTLSDHYGPESIVLLGQCFAEISDSCARLANYLDDDVSEASLVELLGSATDALAQAAELIKTRT